MEGDSAQGYQKRKVASFDLQPGPNNGENTLIAFRLTIEASVDNDRGEVPMMRDMFLEGFTLHSARSGLVRKEPKQCIIF